MAMDGRETGTVKAWIEERGMGFVTPSAGGIDHFVHRSMLTDGQSLQVGAQVTFVPNWDAQKDKPIATQITGACPAPGAAPGGGGWGAPQPREGFEIGTVKAWIDARGMGFITPPDGGEDLFVHRSFLADGVSLVVGSQVQYVRGWDAQKNKGIAQNVSGASQVQQAAPMKGCAKGGGKGGGGFGDNLYITGLPKDATDESIRQIFGQYGVVSRCKVLPDNGSAERVALVQMGAPEQAEWLVWNLDGNIPLGLSNVIGVKHHAGNGAGKGGAVMPPSWGAGGGAWGGPPAGGPPAPAQPGDNLYISGLPLDTTTESVTTLLGQYGTIVSAKVLETAGKPDKVAMVKFSSLEEAKWVLENLNGNIPAGIDSVIHVKYAANKQAYAAPKGGDAWGKGGGYGPAKGGDAWAKGGTGWTSTPYGGKGKGPQNVAPPGGPQHIPPPPAGKKDRLNISGLPADSTEESVMGLIGQYGAVSHVKMLPGNGGPRTAIVQMGEEDSAKWLVDTLNNNIPQGIDTPVQISFATSTPPPAAGAWGGGGGAQWSGAPTTGTVKHWVEERGMGFITPAEGGQDCFIHRSDLMDGLSLVVGAQVNFVPGWDNLKQKPTATQVTGAIGGDGVGKGAMKMEAKGKGKGDGGKQGLW